MTESRAVASGTQRNADEHCRMYEALQLQTKEVTKERDHLRADLSELWQQVALLMVERDQAQVTHDASATHNQAEDGPRTTSCQRTSNLCGDNWMPGRGPGVGPRRWWACIWRSTVTLFAQTDCGFLNLEPGSGARRPTGLVEEDGLEIYNLDQFLLALRQHFEDPLAEEKAPGELQRLRQGNRSLSDFAGEFHRLASWLRGWPKMDLVQIFKDALHPKLLQWALVQGDQRHS
uniref:Uncharacterized protein n=1 Tax=Sphaerodactylus townsendi TaxID=933632 RepID=A0ACB8F7R2_9SAUR